MLTEKKRIIIQFLIIVFIFASCTTRDKLNSPNQAELKEPISFQEIGNKRGNRAVDFTVSTIEGGSADLNDYIGKKPVLLYFWASWCPHCANDFSVIRNVYPKYKDEVEFLAVDLDLGETKEIIERYKIRNGLNDIDFAFGNPKILSDYNVRFTTTKFAIAKNGTILWTGSGEADENIWNVIFQGLKNR